MSHGSINRAIIIGNLGADPELRTTTNGSQVASLRIATSESWKDRNTGERQDKTEWHAVTMYGKLAEIAGQYLHKGAKVYIEGRIQTRKWQDKEGKDRYTTEIVANEMQMLDGRSGTDRKATDPAEALAYREASGGSAKRAAPPEPFDDFDRDEIPFS